MDITINITNSAAILTIGNEKRVVIDIKHIILRVFLPIIIGKNYAHYRFFKTQGLFY